MGGGSFLPAQHHRGHLSRAERPVFAMVSRTCALTSSGSTPSLATASGSGQTWTRLSRSG